MDSTAISMVYSNLAKAAEKQQNAPLVERYTTLAGRFKKTGSGTAAALLAGVSDDLASLIPEYRQAVRDDRGALRALKWGETVAKIQKSILDRYLKKGEEVFNGKDFYVCQACGFIFVGNESPPLCAACKAPSHRFEKIK